MRQTSSGQTDALAISGELFVPLVILKNENKNITHYIGFIPGILMKNISADTLEDCKAKLKNYLVLKLKDMVKNNEPFPFFPTKEEIYKDYDNIEHLEFVKIKSENRKN